MAERKQRKKVQITGLETLQQEDTLSKERIGRKEKYFSLKKQQAKDTDEANSPQPASREIIDRLDRVNSSMTVEQLRREFLQRNPSKKKIARGKWASWFLLQLGEGSICVVPETKLWRDAIKRPESPQESVSNTVSTLPSIFSVSTASTATVVSSNQGSGRDKTSTLNPTKATREDDVLLQGDKKESMGLGLGSKQKHLNVSKITRKVTQGSVANAALREGKTETATSTGAESESKYNENKTKQTRRSMGNKEKYFNASKATRNNANCDPPFLYPTVKRSAEAKDSKQKEAPRAQQGPAPKSENTASQQSSVIPASGNKSSKFASTTFLRNVKEARKQSQRSAQAIGSKQKEAPKNPAHKSDNTGTQQSSGIPAGKKSSKFASTTFLSNVKEARKQSRRRSIQLSAKQVQ